MCVILTTKTNRVPAWALKRAHDRNPHGAGLAWFEDGVVQWTKARNLDEIVDLCKEVPKPYVVHFRWATMGPKTPTLCHPFPIRKRPTDELDGTARAVLFHNGTFKDWADELAARPGTWSDSRALAVLVAHKGRSVLKRIGDNRVAFMNSRKRSVTLYGRGWCTVQGFTMSNTRWLPAVPEKRRERQRELLWEVR
jgi:hypothetical protein